MTLYAAWLALAFSEARIMCNAVDDWVAEFDRSDGTVIVGRGPTPNEAVIDLAIWTAKVPFTPRAGRGTTSYTEKPGAPARAPARTITAEVTPSGE